MGSSVQEDGQLGILRGVRHLGAALACLLVVALIVWLAVPGGGILSLVILGSGVVILGNGLVRLVIAKGRVLGDGEVQIWKGLARLVSWNPAEGVVFLRNKNIAFVDDNPNDGGGIRIIYPLLGEELALRIPLEIQTLPFEDSQVLTKEYLPLSVKGTIYWKVSHLDRFYLNISREIHSVNDSGGHSVEVFARNAKFEVAEQWLRVMAEEKTRTIVSRIGTGLLISDQLSSDMRKAIPESTSFLRTVPESSPGYRGATDGLAASIKADFGGMAQEYGLHIHEVRLQEVRLPPDIYEAAVAACKASYLPLKAQAEAIQRRLMLQAEADVIGKDATGLKEVAASIPALAFQEFLAPLFLDFNRARKVAVSSTS
jgi:regulator of protease activity HflC (stomatin/prohibitin superfamily)